MKTNLYLILSLFLLSFGNLSAQDKSFTKGKFEFSTGLNLGSYGVNYESKRNDTTLYSFQIRAGTSGLPLRFSYGITPWFILGIEGVFGSYFEGNYVFFTSKNTLNQYLITIQSVLVNKEKFNIRSSIEFGTATMTIESRSTLYWLNYENTSKYTSGIFRIGAQMNFKRKSKLRGLYLKLDANPFNFVLQEETINGKKSDLTRRQTSFTASGGTFSIGYYWGFGKKQPTEK